MRILKILSVKLSAILLVATLVTPNAKAALDPYAVLTTATVAAYTVVALGATAAIAGGIWSTKRIASKEVILQAAQEDAVAFIVNEGLYATTLLQTIFEETRKDMSASEKEMFSDMVLAEMIIKDLSADMLPEVVQ
jgi:nitrate reductase gamma subunit